MDYRNLGRTGVKVSPLCLGCMNFGGKTDADDSYAIIDRAIDAGVNFLDTANVYSRGESEKVTGEALKRNGKRDFVVLATKVHGRMADDDPNAEGNSRRHIVAQCEQSLKRLQTDWIDLYQIHRPRPETPIDETLRALDDLVTSGKVRYLGASTFAAWQLVEALWVAKELRLNRFVCEQPPYHPLDRRVERELIPMARTYGIALIPWSPLAGGFLTGKYQRNEQPPENARFGPEKHFRSHAMLGQDKTFDILEGMQAIAGELNCTVSQLALAWNFSQPGVTSPIIGPRTMEQLEDNLGAIDVQLADDHRKRIDELAPPGSVTVPFYQANWGPHDSRLIT